MRRIAFSLLAVGIIVGSAVDRTSAGQIYTTSFESPVVSGRDLGRKVPAGWVGESGYYLGHYGLENTNSGNFSTTYGAQAACPFHASSSFTTAEATLGYNVLAPGVTYTVSFNAALPSDLTAGGYRVELVALDVGEARNGNDLGALLASTNGTAALSDMSESASFSFMASAGHPDLYKFLAVRIDGADGQALIDNLTVADDGSGDVSPPVLVNTAPADDTTGVATNAGLGLRFNETIVKAVGNIVLKRASDNAVIETFDVASNNVTVVNGRELVVSRSVALEAGVAYYVQFDAGIVEDANGNASPVGIGDATSWSFTTLVDGAGPRLLLSDSFESPDVTGSQNWVAPDNWNLESGGSLSYWKMSGLADEGAGTFSTPYGEQAATVWGVQSSLTSKDSATPSEAFVADITYTVTFNVAKGSNRSGDYNVELVAFDPGDGRDDFNAGTVVASDSGTAAFSGMIETHGFSFTPDASDPSVGKLLGVQLQGSGALIDNLTLSDNASGDVSPPSLLSSYPADDATTMVVDWDLSAVFTEAITNGAGSIVIKKASDHSTVEALDVNSGGVSISGDALTINPAGDLERGTDYYIQIGTNAIHDLAGNAYVGITNATDWSFSTVIADSPFLIYADSFESPEVVGSKVETAPGNWNRETSGTLGYWRSSGLANTNGGSFVTPYGVQAAAVWNASHASLTLQESAVSDVLVAETTYTVTFNVANAAGMSGQYRVELVAFDPGDSRDDLYNGTVLASVSGTATWRSMAAEAAGFSFTPDELNPNLGKLVGRQVQGGGALVDNLKFTYFRVPAGSVFVVR